MRLLVAEDDEDLSARLNRALGEAGFAIDLVRSGQDAAHLADTESYDCVVLDLGLPQVDGIEVLRRIRSGGSDVPVLVLTARDAWIDKAAGFKAGADDYLTKPFLAQELVTRIRALIRRATRHVAEPINCGHLIVRPGQRRFRDRRRAA